ncbi:MAG: hypothetical protein KC657_35920 [Myxococcales bacterium]|nr:hypothetical protein [Myxococcales bacterium]
MAARHGRATTTGAVAIAIAGSLLVGCARPSVVAAPPAVAASGETVILVEDHLPAPFEIERIVLAVDGEEVYVRDDDRGLKLSRNVAFRQRVEVGEHSVSLHMRVRTPCGLGSQPRLLHELRGARSFTVGSRGGTLTIDVFSGGPLLAEEGPRVDYRASGSVREGGTLHYRFPECQGESPVARALCTADRMMLRAREVRDLVWLACLRDRRRAIASLTDDDATRDRRAADLELELHECRGLDVEITSPVVTVRDECGAVGALP